MQQVGYAVVQRETVSGRALEKAILEKVTMRMKASQTDDPSGILYLMNALHQNRELWITLAIDLASPENEFPNELKASLISIAGYVERNTHSALRNRDVLASLIEINESIAAGLDSKSEPHGAAAGQPDLCLVSS